jgi:hypothetical protein
MTHYFVACRAIIFLVLFFQLFGPEASAARLQPHAHSLTLPTTTCSPFLQLQQSTTGPKVNATKMGMPKDGKGAKVAVVIGAVLLLGFVGAGIFVFAWAGASTTALALIGIAATGLIVFFAYRIIRRINRRRGTASLRKRSKPTANI